MTVKTHPKVTLQTFAVRFKPSQARSRDILTLAAQYAIQWGKEGWGGRFGPTGVIFTTPSLSREEAWHSMAPMMDLVSKMGDDDVEQKSMTTHHGLLDFVKFYASQHIPVCNPLSFLLSTRLEKAAKGRTLFPLLLHLTKN